MKNKKINNDTIIQVHFNDDQLPTEANHATYIDGKFVVLIDESGIDMNDLEDIKELSHDGEKYESHEESVHPYYYEVKNEDFPQPFSDNDIPEHFFKLGILSKYFVFQDTNIGLIQWVGAVKDAVEVATAFKNDVKFEQSAEEMLEDLEVTELTFEQCEKLEDVAGDDQDAIELLESWK